MLKDVRSKNHSVPFIALTETWLKSYIDDAQLDIPGYNLFRSDRSARVGGGVLLYSHENLPISNVKTYDDQICQVLICTCETSKTVICVLYRPPDAAVLSFRSCLDFIDDYIKDIRDEYVLTLLGDYNLPVVNWTTHSMSNGALSQLESAGLLLDFMSENLCSQYVLQPTRQDNILDLFISNSDELVTHVSTSDTILSDHRLVEIFWSYNPCSVVPRLPPDFTDSTFRSLDFTKADFLKMSNLIESVDWTVLWNTCDSEDFPELFTHTVLQICELSCPKKIPPKSKTSPSVRIPSRKKRKLQTRLKTAENNPFSTAAHIASLNRKLAMSHIDIRDAINKDLLHQEQLAVSKVKTNPKYFYSYIRKEVLSKEMQYQYVI